MLDVIRELELVPPRGETVRAAPPSGGVRSLELLGAPPRTVRIAEASDDADALAIYRALRHAAFVETVGVFAASDRDEHDDDPATAVLVARDHSGSVIGGVRIHPHDEATGWWIGSRLVVAPHARRAHAGTGQRLVRAACALAEARGALRFEATVLEPNVAFFRSLGWDALGATSVRGVAHRRMRWPIRRIARLVEHTKAPLGELLGGLRPGGAGFVGDDGAPVDGTDIVICCDAILPSMVDADPQWAGWCAVLVNANDLAAMGASRLACVDTIAAPTREHAGRVLDGIVAASQRFSLPLVGGHTQIGPAAACSITAVGQASPPVPGGGGRPGDEVRLLIDLGGGWRPGYEGRQWDSTSSRSPAEISSMLDAVARSRPRAAKDVSMAGIAGSLAMLAEASGCGAVIDVAAVPRPRRATAGDWMTCFPGFGMLTAGDRGQGPTAAPAVAAPIGRLRQEPGVALRWPDGEVVEILAEATGLGRA